MCASKWCAKKFVTYVCVRLSGVSKNL